MILAAFFLVALGSPQSQSQPQTPPPAAATPEAVKEDPAVTALALKVYGQMRAGKVDPTLLTDQMNAALTPDVMAQSQPMFEQLGDPTKLVLEKKTTLPQGTLWTYLATFPTAQFHVAIVLDAAGKIAGYRLFA